MVKRFITWLYTRFVGPIHPPPTHLSTTIILAKLFVASAKELTAKYRDWEASGEAKRHQVYAELIKRYPSTDKRLLSLAIELALLEED